MPIGDYIPGFNDPAQVAGWTSQQAFNGVSTQGTDYAPSGSWQFRPESYGAAGDGSSDDSAAFRETMTAACNHALNSPGRYAEIILSPSPYKIASATLPGTEQSNAQIPLTYVPRTTDRIELAMIGSLDSGWFSNGYQTDGPRNGTVLLGTLTGQSYDATYGNPCLLGGWMPEQGAGNGAEYANMLLTLRGLAFVLPTNMTYSAVDVRGIAEVAIDRCVATGDAPLTSMSTWNAIGTTAYGFAMPMVTNNAYSKCTRVVSMGFQFGMLAGEHTDVDELGCVYNYYGLAINGGGHPIHVGHYIAENNHSHIFPWTTTGSTGNPALIIDVMSSENPTYVVDDASNVIQGYIGFTQLQSNPTNNGGTNLKIVRLDENAGNIGSVTLPGTGSAFPIIWRDTVYTVTSGTVTAITVDGLDTGLTSGTIFVPSGKSFVMTYTGTPVVKGYVL